MKCSKCNVEMIRKKLTGYIPDGMIEEGRERIRMKSNGNAILFEDIGKDDKILASIGFQISNGRFTVYMKGYNIDSEEFPMLEGYYGYTLTARELEALFDFIISLGKRKRKVPKRPRRHWDEKQEIRFLP